MREYAIAIDAIRCFLTLHGSQGWGLAAPRHDDQPSFEVLSLFLQWRIWFLGTGNKNCVSSDCSLNQTYHAPGTMVGPAKRAHFCEAIQEDKNFLRFRQSRATTESGVVGGSFCECMMLQCPGKVGHIRRADHKFRNLGVHLNSGKTSLY
ncbi:hypothetical protein BGW80DRAFT_1272478 [Lactifluus volemus]|nr:hypothetical protein BGW80DRAFT_1272478 [Lactifluus volemus]